LSTASDESFRQRLRRSIDEMLEEQLAGRELDAAEEAKLDAALAEGMDNGSTEAAELLLPELLTTVAETAAAERESWSEFGRDLREAWGRPFDLLLCLIRASEEVLEEVTTDEHPDRHDDLTFSVVARLAAAGTRAAWEVHQLVTSGLPEGAAARARTIHETAVVTTLLLDDDDGELVQRFHDHRAVRQFHWAKQVAALVTAGKLPPHRGLRPDELTVLSREVDELLRTYGSRFGQIYGWAAPLVKPGQRLSFETLEKLAGYEHLRPTYAENSLPVHPQAWTLDLAEVEGNTTSRGRSMDLADPMCSAAVSLTQLTTTVLAGLPHERSPADVLYMRVLMALTEEIQTAAAAAEERATTGGLTP